MDARPSAAGAPRRPGNAARLSRIKTFALISVILELRACSANFSQAKSSIVRQQLWDVEGLTRDTLTHAPDKGKCVDNVCSDKDIIEFSINNNKLVKSAFDRNVSFDFNHMHTSGHTRKTSRHRNHSKHTKNMHRKKRQVSKKSKTIPIDDDYSPSYDDLFSVSLKSLKPGSDRSLEMKTENTSSDALENPSTETHSSLVLDGGENDRTEFAHHFNGPSLIESQQKSNKNDNININAVREEDAVTAENVELKRADKPMMLMQDQDGNQKETVHYDDFEDEEGQMAVVPKCCPMGQNLSQSMVNGSRPCAGSLLTFQPLFFDFNGTFMWEYDNNVWETIVGNPCLYDKYRLDPERDSKDEFYLLTNGSLLAPFHNPRMLGPREYCMETFWDGSSPGGIVMPLVCFPTPPTDEATAPSTFIAYAVGLLVSVPFLLATAAVYLLIPDLRNNHGLALSCHAICLASAFACLAATQLAGHSLADQLCHVIAFVIQFSFLACFFWLNVLCVDTWLIVTRHLTKGVSHRRERRRFLWYSLYAWILPLLLLGITMLMDLTPIVPATFIKPNFGASGCWFQTDKAAFPYFYGPVALIIAANIVFFVLTSRSFAKQHELLNRLTVADLTRPDYGNSEDWMRLNEALEAASGGGTADTSPQDSPVSDRPLEFKHRWRKYKKIFRMCCLLSVVMGLSWALEIISWAAGGPAVVWSVFDVINALQGVIIFVIFVMQKSVRNIVWKRIKEKSTCGRWNHDSEMEVVSERTVITTFQPSTNNGRKREYV